MDFNHSKAFNLIDVMDGLATIVAIGAIVLFWV